MTTKEASQLLRDYTTGRIPVWGVPVENDPRLDKGRPAYELFFALANKAVTSPADLWIISNTVISFNETLHLLDDCNLDDVCSPTA